MTKIGFFRLSLITFFCLFCLRFSRFSLSISYARAEAGIKETQRRCLVMKPSSEEKANSFDCDTHKQWILRINYPFAFFSKFTFYGSNVLGWRCFAKMYFYFFTMLMHQRSAVLLCSALNNNFMHCRNMSRNSSLHCEWVKHSSFRAKQSSLQWYDDNIS